MPLPYWEPEYADARRLLIARCLGPVVGIYLVTGASVSDVEDALCRGFWVSPHLSPAHRATSTRDPFGVTDAGTGATCARHSDHDLAAVSLKHELSKAFGTPGLHQRAARTVRLRPESAKAA